MTISPSLFRPVLSARERLAERLPDYYDNVSINNVTDRISYEGPAPPKLCMEHHFYGLPVTDAGDTDFGLRRALWTVVAFNHGSVRGVDTAPLIEFIFSATFWNCVRKTRMEMTRSL